jgi:hypothetical protein
VNEIRQNGVNVAQVVEMLASEIELTVVVFFQRQLPRPFSCPSLKISSQCAYGVIFDIRVFDEFGADFGSCEIIVPSGVS